MCLIVSGNVLIFVLINNFKMAKSQEGEKKSEEAPRIFRFLIRVWGAVAALCKLYIGYYIITL